eukprot:13420450-Alexandrium_andersonii.AAC.1
MSGGLPDTPPGLDPGAPRPKLSRSAGAAPSARSSSTAPTAATSLTTFGPSGAVGVGRRAAGGQSQQTTSTNPERGRVVGRPSGEAGWQGGLADAISRSASAAGRSSSVRGSGSWETRRVTFRA